MILGWVEKLTAKAAKAFAKGTKKKLWGFEKTKLKISCKPEEKISRPSNLCGHLRFYLCVLCG